MAVRYSTEPTGTGFSKVEGSRAMNFGRECDMEEAHVKASSKVDFRRNPPNIMKLWRFRLVGGVSMYGCNHCRWREGAMVLVVVWETG